MENYLDLGDKNALQEVFAEYPYVRGNLFHHLRDLLGNLPEGGTSILDRFAEAIESTPGLFLPPETPSGGFGIRPYAAEDPLWQDKRIDRSGG